MFTKIMDLESPKEIRDKIKCEYEGGLRVRNFRLLILKREFELLKMKDTKAVKDYSVRLMGIVN